METISEFAGKQKPGQSRDITSASDLIELLTQHEKTILKHIYDEVDWSNAKQATAYQFLDDPYHKLDDERKIRMPVHIPRMFSYTFLGLVMKTTATQKSEDKAQQHTERAVWTSKRAREALRNRRKKFIDGISKPQWLDDEITKRNKAMTNEEKKVRKAANLNKPGAAKAGEPPDWSDDGLGGHEPKPKKEPKPWDPVNRRCT